MSEIGRVQKLIILQSLCGSIMVHAGRERVDMESWPGYTNVAVGLEI